MPSSRLQKDNTALLWLQDSELDDGNSCLLRRVISEGGRSRAWINGTTVTLQQLSTLGELLVEIHGQNEHILLVQNSEQFRLLDGSGDYPAELKKVNQSYEKWSALEHVKQSLLDETPLDAGDMDLIRYQIRELEGSMIPADEFTRIEAEHKIMARGGEVLESLEFASRSLESEDAGASQVIHRVADQLELHAPLDPDIASAVELLRSAAINCDEAHNNIQSARIRLDLSPERLAEMERQLSTQHDLARKHRVQPDNLQQVLDELKARFDRAGSLEQRLAQVQEQLNAALGQYRAAAATLHAQRGKHAQELADSVTALMQQLGMEGGKFEFQVIAGTDATPTSRGTDQLELRVSANPGVAPGLLRKVASGGELSRISLAIKVAAKAGSAAPTQVFDEVDAGIGGDTANAVGALLKSLSASGQALCVTHLAQVAAFADHQFRVLKNAGESETRIQTSLLADEERVDEIARMLGGRLSEQSRAHASELLTTASTRH